MGGGEVLELLQARAHGRGQHLAKVVGEKAQRDARAHRGHGGGAGLSTVTQHRALAEELTAAQPAQAHLGTALTRPLRHEHLAIDDHMPAAAAALFPLSQDELPCLVRARRHGGGERLDLDR